MVQMYWVSRTWLSAISSDVMFVISLQHFLSLSYQGLGQSAKTCQRYRELALDTTVSIYIEQDFPAVLTMLAEKPVTVITYSRQIESQPSPHTLELNSMYMYTAGNGWGAFFVLDISCKVDASLHIPWNTKYFFMLVENNYLV